jgi:hypothetical protein
MRQASYHPRTCTQAEISVARRGRTAPDIKVERVIDVIDVHHVPLARTCVTTTVSPVPLGAQMA